MGHMKSTLCLFVLYTRWIPGGGGGGGGSNFGMGVPSKLENSFGERSRAVFVAYLKYASLSTEYSTKHVCINIDITPHFLCVTLLCQRTMFGFLGILNTRHSFHSFFYC